MLLFHWNCGLILEPELGQAVWVLFLLGRDGLLPHEGRSVVQQGCLHVLALHVAAVQEWRSQHCPVKYSCRAGISSGAPEQPVFPVMYFRWNCVLVLKPVFA